MNQELKDRLSQINSEEIETIIHSYSYVALLIAGADGEIDVTELDWGSKVAHIRSYNDDYKLKDLFEEVEKSFQPIVENALKEMPNGVDGRYEYLSPHLGKVNEILAKLDNENAHLIYKSLLSFAKHIAKADGGFFGFGSISSEEKKLISLPMIEPIESEIQE